MTTTIDMPVSIIKLNYITIVLSNNLDLFQSNISSFDLYFAGIIISNTWVMVGMGHNDYREIEREKKRERRRERESLPVSQD